ncbi:MAG: Rpn family recombination-promoting nuclease/putative transposase [Romboutsia timonensis]|uniref:Rpn family recombination-promoting nuclease/putative transposase n=1 Tax=Romboutsia timonensis TaxID=1776391 RepID=UPI002A758C34|nr:Rpn family recombination-promoting nuclease/putative transposase [Romboutsia timonensis]MDY3001879.1 Rpn family recombination-promoting nuclease/putative transposase [Romboutsia timonensis]
MRRTLLNPKIDFVFKKIFGSEEHPEILISFLNAVLKPKKPIVSVEIKNSDLEKEYIEDKFSRLDVKALTSNKEIINIEIQLKNEYNMIQRSLYYWSKLYEEQLSEGDRYDKLSRTVCINILDFKYLKNDRFHNGYRLKEIETNEELTDLQEIHFIEIPKLKRFESTEEIVDLLEGWVEFLRDPESEVIRKLEMSNKEIREAKDELYRLSRNSKERELYYLREKSLRDEISALANAKEKGLKEGLKQGLLEGKLESARSFLDILDDDTIATKLNIDVDIIKKLRIEKLKK